MVDVYENFDWPYEEALTWMCQAHEDVTEGRRAPVIGIGMHRNAVITLGRHTSEEQILARDEIKRRKIAIHRIERGGGATAHEPGQLVLYPIIPLTHFGDCGVRDFTERLENALLKLLAELGIRGSRKCSAPGIFIGEQKIAQLGFRVKSGVILHGLAFNILNSLTTFSLITPCGVANNNATSLSAIKSAEDWEIPELGARLIAHLVGREDFTRVIR